MDRHCIQNIIPFNTEVIFQDDPRQNQHILLVAGYAAKKLRYLSKLENTPQPLILTYEGKAYPQHLSFLMLLRKGQIGISTIQFSLPTSLPQFRCEQLKTHISSIIYLHRSYSREFASITNHCNSFYQKKKEFTSFNYQCSRYPQKFSLRSFFCFQGIYTLQFVARRCFPSSLQVQFSTVPPIQPSALMNFYTLKKQHTKQMKLVLIRVQICHYKENIHNNRTRYIKVLDMPAAIPIQNIGIIPYSHRQ